MALSIKTDEADALARALAAETGETLTQAVTTALRERLERVRGSAVDYQHAITGLVVEYREHRVDHRTPDEIIDYDELGLPR